MHLKGRDLLGRGLPCEIGKAPHFGHGLGRGRVRVRLLAKGPRRGPRAAGAPGGFLLVPQSVASQHCSFSRAEASVCIVPCSTTWHPAGLPAFMSSWIPVLSILRASAWRAGGTMVAASERGSE